MSTQTKNRLFGILLIAILTACIFLTMTPIALADEPPVPELYDEGNVPEEAGSEELPQVMPIAADDEVPALYEDELEVMPIAADDPQPELISEQPQAVAKTLPTWSWIVIIAASASASALAAAVILKGKNKKAAAQ